MIRIFSRSLSNFCTKNVEASLTLVGAAEGSLLVGSHDRYRLRSRSGGVPSPRLDVIRNDRLPSIDIDVLHCDDLVAASPDAVQNQHPLPVDRHHAP